ncbi:hypothetical protein GCM10009117_16160 [Gangjinia marincola]|uniref:DUF2383 domain-containing protein n=1 Tax=Gangjinia marincola TaxID=578463 RepID=A0ABP3XX72_9FLAO
MSYSEKVSSKLNDLLARNYDSEKGYQEAAEKVEYGDLKAFFKEKAQERYDFGHEIKEEIRSFGESPEKGTSIAGDAHRAWMNVKSLFSQNDKEAMVEEALRGETTMLENYNEVLEETNLPPSTRNVLIKQRDAIQGAINNNKMYENIVS